MYHSNALKFFKIFLTNLGSMTILQIIFAEAGNLKYDPFIAKAVQKIFDTNFYTVIHQSI